MATEGEGRCNMAIRVQGRTLLDRFEVSDMLGIAPRTLNWRTNHGHMIQPVKIGNRPYWRLSEIAKWLDDLEHV